MRDEPIRIILVDDHHIIRESWTMLLGNDQRFTIIAQCRNGAEAIEAASRYQPDIMLMDINMKPINGFEATQRIVEQFPSARIIGISANHHPGYANRMLELGARGFVTKSSSFDELTTAIVKVHEGELYVCEEVKL